MLVQLFVGVLIEVWCVLQCRCPMTPTAVVDIVPLSCGQSHAAAVVQGDVYTWGQAQSGRLEVQVQQSLCATACKVSNDLFHFVDIDSNLYWLM